MSKAKMTSKVVDATLLALEKGAEALERGVKVKNRIQNAVNQGKGKGRSTAQRKSAMGNPMRAPGLSPMSASGAPVAVSYPQGPTYHVVTKTTPEVTSVRGRAFLGNVNSTGGAYNIVGGTFSLNPVLLNDRLAVMATTFDKYVYKRAKICYVPFAATSQQGQVYLYLDRDYLDPLADPAQVGQVMSQYNAIADQPWKNMSTALTRDPTEKRTYFTLLNQAQLPETEQFRVCCYVTASGFTGIVGQLYLEYDLDLVGPVYAPSENAGLSNFTFSKAVTPVGTTTTGADIKVYAGNNVCTAYVTTGAAVNIFGIPDNDPAILWEVVFSDVGSAGPITPAGLHWGSAGTAGPVVTFANGTTWYVVRSQFSGTSNLNQFNVFQHYQEAISGEGNVGTKALYNATGSDILLGAGSYSVLVRKISDGVAAVTNA